MSETNKKSPLENFSKRIEDDYGSMTELAFNYYYFNSKKRDQLVGRKK